MPGTRLPPDIVPTMSDHVEHTKVQDSATPAPRGQAFVEFALVLPMLLVLLLGIADFGRVFSAGIALEAAARDAAEVGALERLRNKPPTDPTTHPAYYENLHAIAAETGCDEMEVVPAPRDHQAGPDCPELSAIRVCVHDDVDVKCGQPIPGFDGSVPPGCDELSSAASNLSGGEIGGYWVEVQVCYQFTTLFNLNLSLPMDTGLNLGEIYLQRSRSFVVDCPPGVPDPTTC